VTDTGGVEGFAGLGLEPRMLSALSGLGYEEPTPIQSAAIPPLLAGRDVLGMAATGTGKTAAFALPMLQRLAGEKRGGVRGLVLVPTRELAMQVSEALHRYGRALHLTVVPVYGGQWIGQQLKALARGVDVVVATPGRALDLMARGSLDLGGVRMAVLDEADEMLDLGFAEAIDEILDATPDARQTALFSATMPPRIAALAQKRLRDPEEVRVQSAPRPADTLPQVRQVAYVVSRAQKPVALQRVLDAEAPSSALVFCRTRGAVDELADTLEAHGYRCAALHGGLTQAQRDRVLSRFRQGGLDLLIATDVAARGLDIPHLSHVVNYDLPSDPNGYVHRIGRTGRAGRTGVALSFAQPREERLLRDIQKVTRQKIEIQKVPTVADLRARRLEATRTALREALVAGGFEEFRAVVESVAEEFDVLDVAAAAVRLVHEGAGAAEAPAAEPRAEVRTAPPPEPRPRRDPETERASRSERAAWGERLAQAAEPAPRRPPRPGGGVQRVFVGAGREAGVRPADIVGALVKGGGLDPQAVGAIHITDRFSIVEIAADQAEAAVATLLRTPLRGRKVIVRLDAPAGGPSSARASAGKDAFGRSSGRRPPPGAKRGPSTKAHSRPRRASGG
jgi:ATP-dependent RNA helicase DeaD